LDSTIPKLEPGDPLNILDFVEKKTTRATSWDKLKSRVFSLDPFEDLLDPDYRPCVSSSLLNMDGNQRINFRDDRKNPKLPRYLLGRFTASECTAARDAHPWYQPDVLLSITRPVLRSPPCERFTLPPR
jgi:hypothetical protein